MQQKNQGVQVTNDLYALFAYYSIKYIQFNFEIYKKYCIDIEK